MTVALKCFGCGTVGEVNKITAGLVCTCGSTELDLYDGPGPEDTFLAYMGAAHGPGTGWNATMPDPFKGWSQYAGPMPGKNDLPTPEPSRLRCEQCKGRGFDMLEGGICRACKGKGVRPSPTSVSPEPLVKRHNYPSTQTKVPFMGQRITAGQPSPGVPAPGGRILYTPEDTIRHTTPGWVEGQGQTGDGQMPNQSPHLKNWTPSQHLDEMLKPGQNSYPMHEANCPKCGTAPTHLIKDYKHDAWWNCPNCGPLINIDRHPEVDPYNPPAGFKPQPRTFKTSRVFGSQRKTGQVLDMLDAVTGTNPGLAPAEALGIVRTTVSKYGE